MQTMIDNPADHDLDYILICVLNTAQQLTCAIYTKKKSKIISMGVVQLFCNSEVLYHIAGSFLFRGRYHKVTW